MVDKIGPRSHLSPETDQTARQRSSRKFDRLLDRVRDSSSQAESPSAAAGVGAPLSAAGVTISPTPPQLVQTERTLGLLERFSSALADPAVTLKQMAPLTEALDKEADRLLALLDDLAEDDRARGIIHETALLAKVQVAKFDRGEFI